MDWTSAVSVPMVRTRGKNHSNIAYDPLTKIFTQLNNPKTERPPKVVLTAAEKKRVVKEFVEVMKRQPGQEEILELYSEELKIKQAHLNNNGSNQR